MVNYYLEYVDGLKGKGLMLFDVDLGYKNEYTYYMFSESAAGVDEIYNIITANVYPIYVLKDDSSINLISGDGVETPYELGR